jgi:hypothetical protein
VEKIKRILMSFLRELVGVILACSNSLFELGFSFFSLPRVLES